MKKAQLGIKKMVAEYLAIEVKSAKETGMLGFIARAFVKATLLHSKPNGRIFQRCNGDYKSLKNARLCVLILTSSFLIGCQKTIYFCEIPVHKISVNQTIATHIQPAQFYLCGNRAYPCKGTQLGKSISHSKTSLKQFKRKSYENHVAKKICTLK